MDAYDSLLVGYQKAAVNTEAIASVLNAGQGAILAVGLTGVLALAAATSPVGSFTAGDLVGVFSREREITLDQTWSGTSTTRRSLTSETLRGLSLACNASSDTRQADPWASKYLNAPPHSG